MGLRGIAVLSSRSTHRRANLASLAEATDKVLSLLSRFTGMLWVIRADTGSRMHKK